MDFKESLDWLYSFEKYGMRLGLERIKFLCEKLRNPQDCFNVIHVGGTNGKGSVCKFLESILIEAGYNVGVYTSPHLHHISERIIVNKKNISEDELVKIIEKLKPIVKELQEKNDNPTFFEIITSIAFEYFKNKKIDIAIVEVGLGGRFDATNIVKPIISVITNVSLEHQNILGKKIEDIAFEKAGIIKKNTPVVTAAKNSALKVIEKKTKKQNSERIIINESKWERKKIRYSNQEFLIKGLKEKYKIKTLLLGEYQGENISLAINTVEFLNKKGYNISKKNITEGISKTVYPGRMEIINKNPIILLDGAHNLEGIKKLVDSLKNDFQYKKIILVIGILSDKSINEMLSEITPIADIIVTTKSRNKRASNPFELKKMIKKVGFNKNIIVEERINDAIKNAKKLADRNDLICITGSLFTVGEAKDIFLTSKNVNKK